MFNTSIVYCYFCSADNEPPKKLCVHIMACLHSCGLDVWAVSATPWGEGCPLRPTFG